MPAESDALPKVAIVLKGYPRLSETFIAQEILALQQGGLNFHLVSLRHPTDKARHPVHAEITASVNYLPEYLHQEIYRVLRGWWHSRKMDGYKRVRRILFRDLKRDFTRNRFRRFGQAMVLAHELPTETDHIYAHFLHTPASVARYAALMSGRSWSCSAHAKDIWTSPEWELAEKLCDLDWLVTCTSANVKYLQDLADQPDKIQLMYHGLDMDRFPEPDKAAIESSSIKILSVGRAVEKKGFDDILTALAMLPTELDWSFTHIGGGPLLDQLKTQAEKLGISGNIDWMGPRPQTDVLAALKNSDIFVLASRIANDGDRDGLPNVLMEAQSQKLVCLATDVSAIPELIENEKSGLLVAQNNPTELSHSMERLIRNPELRQQLSDAGYRKLTEKFDAKIWIEKLMDNFRRQGRQSR
jgi:glycosyltransferase involved in cell wall biosynthesis